RTRGLRGPHRRSARVHGPVPHVGPDDVGVLDSRHRDGEGEQGGGGAAGFRKSRRDPRRQTARPRRRGTPAGWRVAVDPHRRGSWHRAVDPLVASRVSMDFAGPGGSVVFARVPVFWEPDARHRLAGLEHARVAAARDDVVAHRRPPDDDDGPPHSRSARLSVTIVDVVFTYLCYPLPAPIPTPP